MFPTSMYRISLACSTGLIGCIGQVLVTKGFQLTHAGIASSVQYMDVVCVLLWDILLFQEKLSMLSILGLLVIVGATFTISMRQMR